MDRAVELFMRPAAGRPREWTDGRVAYAVGCQWRAAQNGLRHIVAFGAMLLEVERWLAERDGKRSGRNATVSLRAWLSEHCPEVNYKTAMGYKAAALGLRQAAQLAADRPLLPLMGEKPLTDEEEERVRAKVMDVIASSSLRLLKEAARAERPQLGGSTKEAAEANGNQVGRPPKKVDPVEDAVKTWTLAMAGIRKIPDFSWKFLPLSEAEGVMVELDGVREKLKARIAELKAAKSGGRSRKEASR